MDYKEKLRLAKEALDSGSYDKETIEYIFPELKGSEDERIRRNIIAALKGEGYYDCDLTNECIAWLEKQGEERTVNYPIEGMFPYTDPADTLDGEIENIWNKLRNCDNTFICTENG